MKYKINLSAQTKREREIVIGKYSSLMNGVYKHHDFLKKVKKKE